MIEVAALLDSFLLISYDFLFILKCFLNLVDGFVVSYAPMV